MLRGPLHFWQGWRKAAEEMWMPQTPPWGSRTGRSLLCIERERRIVRGLRLTQLQREDSIK